MTIDVTQIVLALISAVIGPVVVIVGVAVARKFGVEMNTKRLELIGEIAAGSVNYAEQWRKRQLTQGTIPRQEEVLHQAIEWFGRRAQERGLASMVRDDINDFIESKLGEKNAARERRARPLKVAVSSMPPPALTSDTRPTPVPAADDADDSDED